MQPELPIHAEPRTIDYYPEGDDGVPWAVKNWPALKETFHISPPELTHWHQDLVNPESRPWLVVRRIFGVVPMFGEAAEDEDNEEWDIKKLSKKWGVQEKSLLDDIKSIVEYSEKLRVSRRIHHSSAVKPLDGPPDKNPHIAIADQEISNLLEEYRFTHLKKGERTFVARRITEMRSIFEDKNRREIARQLVIMELNLQDNEHARSLLKTRLENLSSKSDRSDLTDKESGEIISINKALEDNEKAHTRLFEKYVKASEDIGSDEIEQASFRKAALGTIGYLVESVREYYKTGDRALIDGVFTADELVWLTTPVSMRPAQYRPDLVISINDAMRPYALFDPQYKPLRIPRDASRRMIKLAKALTEEKDHTHIPEIDDAPSDTEEDSYQEPHHPAQPEESETTTPTHEHSPTPDTQASSEEFMAM